MMLTSIVLAGLICACLTPDKNPEPKEKHIVISLIIGFAIGIGLFNIEVGADRYPCFCYGVDFGCSHDGEFRHLPKPSRNFKYSLSNA